MQFLGRISVKDKRDDASFDGDGDHNFAVQPVVRIVLIGALISELSRQGNILWTLLEQPLRSAEG
jgi:hypothetical protein